MSGWQGKRAAFPSLPRRVSRGYQNHFARLCSPYRSYSRPQFRPLTHDRAPARTRTRKGRLPKPSVLVFGVRAGLASFSRLSSHAGAMPPHSPLSSFSPLVRVLFVRSFPAGRSRAVASLRFSAPTVSPSLRVPALRLPPSPQRAPLGYVFIMCCRTVFYNIRNYLHKPIRSLYFVACLTVKHSGYENYKFNSKVLRCIRQRKRSKSLCSRLFPQRERARMEE